MQGTDFTKDRITGFYNILGLIEYDLEKQSEREGVIIAIAINNLRDVNAKYSRDIGNIYVLNFSIVLNNVLEKLIKTYEKATIFKSSANEYVVLIPGIKLDDAEEVVSNIELSFKDKMFKNNILNASLNCRRVSYYEGIPNISCLLKWLNKSFLESNYTEVLPCETEDWTDKLIERIVYSFKDNLTLLREIDYISLSDDVSKLLNHRAAELFLLQQIDNYKTKKQDFGVLFIDGDNLKRYNQLGYQQGNQMIEGLSKIVSNSIREDDKVFRWLSGDEFLVVLGNTELEGTMNIAERLRYSVEQSTKDWQYPITISIGVSNCPFDGISVDMLVGKAEKANSMAKNSGKNKVVHCSNLIGK